MIELFQRARELASSAAKVPERLANREDAEKAADFVRQLTACIQRLEDAEKDEKFPHSEALKMIRAKYSKPLAELLGIKAIVVGAQTAYLERANTDEVRSDYNSLTVLRETETVAVREDIDLNLLKPWIDWESVTRAARKAVKAGQTIPGVDILKERKAVTR